MIRWAKLITAFYFSKEDKTPFNPFFPAPNSLIVYISVSLHLPMYKRKEGISNKTRLQNLQQQNTSSEYTNKIYPTRDIKGTRNSKYDIKTQFRLHINQRDQRAIDVDLGRPSVSIWSTCAQPSHFCGYPNVEKNAKVTDILLAISIMFLLNSEKSKFSLIAL